MIFYHYAILDVWALGRGVCSLSDLVCKCLHAQASFSDIVQNF